MLALERVRALQRAPVRVALRWGSNVGLFVIGAIASALLLPVGLYAYAAQQAPGLMTELGLPLAVQIVATFVLLDLWKYGEHRLFHGVPLLWRCHLVHHSDTDVDVTTTERHHPVEVLIGAGVLIALVAALRPPAVALGVYLLAATAVSLAAHANVRLPARLEAALRRVIVTPAVHAVHHSSARPQTDSNFGMVLTVWDRVFGTFVDPSRARIAHFGLDYFHRPEDTRLWRVLQQPFRFRRDLAYPPRADGDRERDAAARPRAARLPSQARHALLAGLAGAALLLVAAWPTVADMLHVWRSSDTYQHAWLVVPMLVYVLVWHDDEGLRVRDPRPTGSGIAVAMAGALLWVAARYMSLAVGEQLGLVIALQGVALATLGWPAYRRLFPALALLFLMIPAGDLLQSVLRAFTVKAIAAFAWAAAIPHSVDGFVVHIGPHRYIVVDECSGLAYVTLAGFLGYSFGLLLYGSFVRAVGMAVVGAALGVLSNVIRVDAIVLVDWLRGSQMDLSAHGALQWIMLVATLAGLLLVLTRSQARASQAPARDAAPTPHAIARMRMLAPVGAALSAVLIGALAFVPGAGEDAAPASWQRDAARATASSYATSVRGDQRMEVMVVQASSAAAKPPEPTLLGGDRSIWREQRNERKVVCADADCLEVRHIVWLREHADDVRHAYVAYDIDGTITQSRLAARALQGWHRIKGRAGPPALLVAKADAALDDRDVVLGLRAARTAVHDAAD